jgi:hypothetical protein
MGRLLYEEVVVQEPQIDMNAGIKAPPRFTYGRNRQSPPFFSLLRQFLLPPKNEEIYCNYAFSWPIASMTMSAVQGGAAL